jgi:hypothetical protein
MSWPQFKSKLDKDLFEILAKKGWRKRFDRNIKDKDFAKNGFKWIMYLHLKKGCGEVRIEAEMKNVEPKLMKNFFMDPPANLKGLKQE